MVLNHCLPPTFNYIYFSVCQRMEIYAPVGRLCGTVEQEWSILSPQFSIKNAAGDTVLRIEGPFCTFTMCGDVEFKVSYFHKFPTKSEMRLPIKKSFESPQTMTMC